MLGEVADHLDALDFALSGPRRSDLVALRDRSTRLVRGVLARVDDEEAPLLVVVGGGSGAGKSTLVNTLAGRAVSTTGVLRPTTRTPTLVCHPQDRVWFEEGPVLASLARVDEQVGTQAPGRQVRVVDSDRLPAGVAVLDTPDVDSVELANHDLAQEALDAADAWVWVATSRTYADRVGMELLRRARDRQALAVVVVGQVRPGEGGEVLADVDRLLAGEGVVPVARLEVPWIDIADSRLPEDTVTELRRWLTDLAPPDRRAEVRREALTGLVAALPGELTALVDAATQERATAERLQAQVAGRFTAVAGQLAEQLEEGLPLRTDVLERWRRLVGGGERLLKVQATALQVRDLVRSRLGVRGADDVRAVQVEVADELGDLLERLLAQAHARARQDLEADPVGRDLLDAHPGLRVTPDDREVRVQGAVDDWQAHVASLIAEVGGPRRAKARRLSTALNAVATSAILVAFSLTAGLTGGELGIAAAAAAANQWLLTRLLGEQNVRRLLDELHADLRRRCDELAAAEHDRFERAIAGDAPSAETVAALRAFTEADS